MIHRGQCWLAVVLICLPSKLAARRNPKLPLVANTWKFVDATKTAWDQLCNGGSRLDAVEKGCSMCEVEQCDFTVGYGGDPDSHGETTLDAMIMDGPTHDVGAVAYLRRIKSAISVARAVMEHTKHSLLVGEGATEFAKMLGFKEETLSTPASQAQYESWVASNCQPNYYTNLINVTTQCPPYTNTDAMGTTTKMIRQQQAIEIADVDHHPVRRRAQDRISTEVKRNNHDTIDNEVGGATGTGDGDVMLRFAPAAMAVEYMRQGMTPQDACETSIQKIAKYYPEFTGGLICVNKQGNFGGAAWGWVLSYTLRDADMTDFELGDIKPVGP